MCIRDSFTPGHCDEGSALTMAVLLSGPDELLGGGQFVTWQQGSAVTHQMNRGDAILFHSEKCHNVAVVTAGMRHSLVIELWASQTNSSNRFS